MIGQLFVIVGSIYCGPLGPVCAAYAAGTMAGVQSGDFGQFAIAAVLTWSQSLFAGEATSAILAKTGFGGSAAGVFVVNGFVGGAYSEIGGGSFASGFLAAGLGSLARPYAIDAGLVGGTIISAVAGGTGSVIGGGKFENGAVTAAFAYAAAWWTTPDTMVTGAEDDEVLPSDIKKVTPRPDLSIQ